jgi:hypothetical protein
MFLLNQASIIKYCPQEMFLVPIVHQTDCKCFQYILMFVMAVCVREFVIKLLFQDESTLHSAVKYLT